MAERNNINNKPNNRSFRRTIFFTFKMNLKGQQIEPKIILYIINLSGEYFQCYLSIRYAHLSLTSAFENISNLD